MERGVRRPNVDVTEPSRRSFQYKADIPENNPCFEEMAMSLKCLDYNNYDRKACHLYQENYKLCRKFWDKVARDRSSRDLYPPLPPPNERESVRAEYNLDGERIVKG
ncbi:hypothetical protein RvY_16994 [Ramazzottius varieornatus]|uniref:Coiled-coil-helix-coiled-coil-helix domain-containing protein 7 n=1 Tax=Ramazzottius varieornatus TaxID=947166 RepID=A0A1D1W7R2_RAMVA|nr:hypothetical protein RvY_16994 [Ramazzottius varieornatus]